MTGFDLSPKSSHKTTNDYESNPLFHLWTSFSPLGLKTEVGAATMPTPFCRHRHFKPEVIFIPTIANSNKDHCRFRV